MFTARSSGAIVAIAVAACSGSKSSTSAAPRIGSAIAATFAAADHDRAPWRCSGERQPPADETLAGGWQLVAGTLQSSTGELVIGVVADAGGNDPKTLAALARLHARFESARVTLVLSLGGMGANRAELEATLGALAGGWPVIAVPGDLEPISDQAAAIAALRSRGAIVLDGRGLRTIDAPGATIAFVPGSGREGALVAGADGCAWSATELGAIYDQLAARPGLRIAASADAPREVVDGEPSGEVALMPTQAIDVLVHGPTHAAPTPATHGGRDGTRVSLSPGTVDATPRLPESRSPAAGVLALDGDRWTWHPVVDAP